MIARSVKIERIWRTAIGLTVALALLCVVAGVGDAASVVFGGLVAVVNFHLIRMLVSRLMSPDAAGSRLSMVVALKFLLLLTLLAVALKRLPIDLASFLVGGGTLVVAIVVDAAWLGRPLETSDDGEGNA